MLKKVFIALFVWGLFFVGLVGLGCNKEPKSAEEIERSRSWSGSGDGSLYYPGSDVSEYQRNQTQRNQTQTMGGEGYRRQCEEMNRERYYGH